jgi:translocation and assembly module TamA
MYSRFVKAILLTVLGLGAAARSFAADPQPYRVELTSIGDSAMDSTLQATSDLASLRGSAPVSPLGLLARARSDVDRLKTVLESFGYYQSTVTVKIDGQALGDAGLGDALTALPSGSVARVVIGFELGPLYRLRKIVIDGNLPDPAEHPLGLAPGSPAVAAQILEAGAALQNALQEQGYAFAKVDPPAAVEDRALPVLDVTFHVVAGLRASVGEIRIEGLKRVHEKLVRDRLRLRTGDTYSPSRIELARQDLLELGVFSTVGVKLGAAADGAGRVPITFLVRERLRHAVSLNVAYSSDLGGSGGVTWSDRDVFGSAERLNLSASAINLGGSATTGIGYDTNLKYVMPDFGRRDQTLQLAAGAIKQSLQAYSQTARTGGVTLTRKLSPIWSVSAGVSGADEQVIQEGQTHDYTLVALPLGISLDSTRLVSPLDDPRHGMRGTLSIAPTRSLGLTSASFVISQLKIAAYFDFHGLLPGDPGRSVLAVRALAGLAQGAAEFSLPPDQRFYGGGSGTIRGYRYQAVGPQFPDGTPIGGTAIVAGSLEWRQRFGTHFGAAVFVDGGQVSASLKPLPSVFRIGAGAGIRYYTPIGPIRLDFAVPTRHYSPDDDRFEIYIGLGQAF